MAQGTIVVYDEALPNLNFSAAASDAAAICIDSSVIKVALTTVDVDTLSAADATPTWSDHSANEVSGNGYTAGGATCTVTVSEANGTLTIALGADVTWTSTGSGDANTIRTAFFYDSTSTSDLLIAYMDMTEDSGTTPLDLNNGDITIQSGTIFSIA